MNADYNGDEEHGTTSLTDFLAESFGLPDNEGPETYHEKMAAETSHRRYCRSSSAEKFHAHSDSESSSKFLPSHGFASSSPGYFSQDYPSSKSSMSSRAHVTDGASTPINEFASSFRSRGSSTDAAVSGAQSHVDYQNRNSIYEKLSIDAVKGKASPNLGYQSTTTGGYAANRGTNDSSFRIGQSSGPNNQNVTPFDHHQVGLATKSDVEDFQRSVGVHSDAHGSFYRRSLDQRESLGSCLGERVDDGFVGRAETVRGSSYAGSRGQGETFGSYRDDSGGRGESLGGYHGSSGGRGEALGGYQGSSGGRGESLSGYHGSSGGRGEALGSYRGSSGGRGEALGGYNGSSGGRGEALGGYHDSSGGHEEARGSYRGSSDGRGEARGSSSGRSGGRGKTQGASPGSSRGREARGSYRGSSRGREARGSSRGSSGGRGESRGSYRSGVGRGEKRGSNFGSKGGRGETIGLHRGNSSGGRGVARGSYRGITDSRGSLSSRGRVASTISARGKSQVSIKQGNVRQMRNSQSDGLSVGHTGFSTSRFKSSTERSSHGKVVQTSSSSKVIENKKFTVVDSYKSSGTEDTENLPTESLQCNVCRVISFKSSSAFDEHIKSQHHSHMLKLLSARNDSLEQFKRLSAKHASRAIEHEVMKNISNDRNKMEQTGVDSKFFTCSYCQCTVLLAAVSMHVQLIQHKELIEFAKPQCCDIKFTSRQSYEAHKTTVKHLKTKYELEKKFIVNAVREIEEEVMKSKGEKVPVKFKVTSVSLPQSDYVIKILKSLESSPLIDRDVKEDFCLACEVTVPKFRRSFHPCCSDHHENTIFFCSKNKIRITARITQYLKELKSTSSSNDVSNSSAGLSSEETKSTKTELGNSAPSTTSSSITAMSSQPSADKKCFNSSSPASDREIRLSSESAAASSSPHQTEAMKNDGLNSSDDEENDDEFDYEFPDNDDDKDVQTGAVPGDRSAYAVVVNDKQNSELHVDAEIEDEFEYEFDATSTANDKILIKNVGDSLNTGTTEELQMSTSGINEENDHDEIDDFEYEYAPEQSAELASGAQPDLDDNEGEALSKSEDIDDFDYQFDDADETRTKGNDDSASRAIDIEKATGEKADKAKVEDSKLCNASLDANEVDEFDYDLAPEDVNSKDTNRVEMDRRNKAVTDDVEKACNSELLEEVEDDFEYELSTDAHSESEMDLEHKREEKTNVEDRIIAVPASEFAKATVDVDANPASSAQSKLSGSVASQKKVASEEYTESRNEPEDENEDEIEDFEYDVQLDGNPAEQEQTLTADGEEEDAEDDEFDYEGFTTNE
ncbi:uncharacterized protein LOC108674063 [Hyalella azteca]|uniref:Uncharacterized protein LOC108674063 n=1 Tax=Hyalella azteca TaxID=294128 RepID=A0A8B7NUR2_HYAAZ|nr:uncharacterized protein LOC108674063 [Hyalella azteca]